MSQQLCQSEQPKCQRPVRAGQLYCYMHRDGGRPLASSMSTLHRFGAVRSTQKEKCQEQGCTRNALASGFCKDHTLKNQANAKNNELKSRLGGVELPSDYKTDIAGSEVDTDRLFETVSQATGGKLNPRDEQLEMTSAIINELQKNDRAQIRAACGMGKTLVQESVIMEYENRLNDNQDRNGTYIVLVPTINLAKQMRRSYEEHGILDLNENSMFSVHHDPSDPNSEPVDENELAEFLSKESDSPRVVFVVNSGPSVDKLIDAQKISSTKADMIIFDEAHKYVVKEDDTSIRPTLFNSPDNCTVNAKTRVFMTATPIDGGKSTKAITVTYSEEAIVDNYLAASRMSREQEKTGSKKARRINALNIDQSQDKAYGRMVANYSTKYAVDKGYLVQPDVYPSGVRINNTTGEYVSRNTRMNHSGATDPNGSLTLGAYQGISSIYDKLSSDGAYRDGGRSNSLIFSNQIEECREIEDNWKSVGIELSTSLNGGQPMSLDEANIHAHDVMSPKRKAARVRLLAEHSSTISTSSKHTESQQSQAREHFDDPNDTVNNGRLKGCSCGQPGRWCPCSRIVANVNMFSEGIDVSSIDTVVLNRPSLSSEQMIVQAVGRSSRRFVNALGRVKEKGNVVIPISRQQDGEVVNQAEVVRSAGGVDKMWRDDGDEFFRTGSGNDTLEAKSETASHETVAEIANSYLTDGFANRGSLEQRVAAAKIISGSYRSVANNYKKELGINKSTSITSPEVYLGVMERVAAGGGDHASKGVDHLLVLRMTKPSLKQIVRGQNISNDRDDTIISEDIKLSSEKLVRSAKRSNDRMARLFADVGIIQSAI